MRVWMMLRATSRLTYNPLVKGAARHQHIRGIAQCCRRQVCTARASIGNNMLSIGSSIKWRSSLPRRWSSRSASTLSEELRHVMRQLTNPVVVLTAIEPDCLPRAMTISSFASLTLHPTPLVTFNIRFPSRTLDALRASEAFYIHILRGDETGARLASRFTQGNEGPSTVQGVSWQGGILNEDGVMIVLKCQLAKGENLPDDGLVVVRDHMLVVADVIGVTTLGKEGSALGYSDRQYRRIGGVIRLFSVDKI